jgi:urease beta subunit
MIMKYRVGEVIYKKEPIIVNDGLDAIEILVKNSGDRCVQVCSHYHFFEANLALKFDREKAFGRRLDIPAGTAVRFEPGESKSVSLVPFRGSRTAIGFLGVTMGDTKDPKVKEAALNKLNQLLKGGE